MNAPSLSALGQIAVAVSDVAAARRFYVDVLGLVPLFDAGPDLSFVAAGGVRIMLTRPQGAGEFGGNPAPCFTMVPLEPGTGDAVERGAPP